MDAVDVTLKLRTRRERAPASAATDAARDFATRQLRTGAGGDVEPRAWLLDSRDTLHEIDLAPLPAGGMPMLLDALEQVIDQVRARRLALLLPSRDGGDAPLVLVSSDGFDTEVRAFGRKGRSVVAVTPPPVATARFERLVRGIGLQS